MNKTIKQIVIGILMLVIFIPTISFAKKIKVVATLPDLASITEAVSGENVEVSAICKGYQDPHYLQAKPSYARKMNNVDLLVFNGLELEIGWLPPLIDVARNPQIRPGAIGCLDCSEGIELLEVPTGKIDRSKGDIHPLGNPHYTLDPRNGIKVAETIANRLAEIDHENADEYFRNFDNFKSMMDVKMSKWEEKAKLLKGLEIVTYHKQWEYLTNWLGLSIVGYVENCPGIPPSPRHLKSFIEMIDKRGIQILLAANFVDVGQAKKAADRSEAKLIILPTLVMGKEFIKSYADLFDYLIEQLIENMEE